MSADLLNGIDLCQFPAGIPPGGQLWDFNNPSSLAPIVIAVCTIMTIWSLVFVGARLWVNKYKLTIVDCMFLDHEREKLRRADTN
jgi:hypothetical protein